MAEAKHTPGRWTFSVLENGAFYITTPECEHEESVTIARRGAWSSRAEESRANARLIAAALDLLQALQAEEEWRGREAVGEIDPEWDYETMVGAKRRAAIAMATGAAPAAQPTFAPLSQVHPGPLGLGGDHG